MAYLWMMGLRSIELRRVLRLKIDAWDNGRIHFTIALGSKRVALCRHS